MLAFEREGRARPSAEDQRKGCSWSSPKDGADREPETLDISRLSALGRGCFYQRRLR